MWKGGRHGLGILYGDRVRTARDTAEEPLQIQQ